MQGTCIFKAKQKDSLDVSKNKFCVMKLQSGSLCGVCSGFFFSTTCCESINLTLQNLAFCLTPSYNNFYTKVYKLWMLYRFMKCKF